VEKLLQTFSDCVQCYENAEKKVKEQKIDWHFVLDAAGLLPGIGAAFDGINTAWYAAEGDWSNALLSGLAFAPGIGEAVGGGKTAVKAGGKVIGHLDEAADIAKAADKVEDAAKIAGKAKKAGENAGELGKYLDEAVEDAGKTINPNEIRYSQSSVNGSNDIIQSMRESGWRGAPIDVVEMPDGIYTTMDNTRVASAREAGIDVQANVHGYDELLPSEYIERFTTKKGVPKTWGEAIELRVGKQKASFRNGNPYGKFDMETIN